MLALGLSAADASPSAAATASCDRRRASLSRSRRRDSADQWLAVLARPKATLAKLSRPERGEPIWSKEAPPLSPQGDAGENGSDSPASVDDARRTAEAGEVGYDERGEAAALARGEPGAAPSAQSRMRFRVVTDSTALARRARADPGALAEC